MTVNEKSKNNKKMFKENINPKVRFKLSYLLLKEFYAINAF